MKKNRLGSTGIDVSRLGLGTVKFGRNEGVKYPEGFEIPHEEFLAEFLALAKSLGINTLDTAPAYGTSEERLGRLLQGQREDWVIIGKVGEEFIDGQSEYIFTPDHFEMSLERSLKRLNTDYIDALLIHSDGNDLNILQNNALIQKLNDFKSQGLIKATGASTKTVEGGKLACDLLDIVMCTYNLDYRDEKPVLDYAAGKHKGVLLKKALGSGHLIKPSAKNCHTDQAQRVEGSEARKSDPSTTELRSSAQDDIIRNPLTFALSHEAVSSAIVGTINPEHLKANAAVAKAQSPVSS